MAEIALNAKPKTGRLQRDETLWCMRKSRSGFAGWRRLRPPESNCGCRETRKSSEHQNGNEVRLGHGIPALILSGRSFSIDEAIKHIAQHGSGLAEAIVTRDRKRAERFFREVDAGAVYVNASTRFTDGGEFGLGAEMGISTQKLHARGPVGLVGLTCEKFVVRGKGQVRCSN